MAALGYGTSSGLSIRNSNRVARIGHPELRLDSPYPPRFGYGHPV